MGRMAGDWIDSYLKYTEELEAPEFYHRWAAMSAIASAARRNVWVDQGHYLLYPNHYIVLIGPHGKIGKSTVIRAAKRLLRKVPDVVIGRDATTREDLIVTLAGIGGPGRQSALAFYSTELASLIEKSKEAMVDFLTDIYDCEWSPDGWREGTKTQGKFAIHNPCVNILAGCTPTWLGERLPVSATESGFTARIIFVFADEPRFLNPRPKEPPEKLVYCLEEDLKGIALLKGKFDITQDAWIEYERIYEQVGKSEPADYRISGYHWRKAKVHILKAAMVLSLSQKDDLIIEVQDILGAERALLDIESGMPKAFSAVGKNPYATDIERIGTQVRKSESGVSMEDIISANYSTANRDILGELVSTIVDSGAADIIRRDGKEIIVPRKK